MYHELHVEAFDADDRKLRGAFVFWGTKAPSDAELGDAIRLAFTGGQRGTAHRVSITNLGTPLEREQTRAT